MDTRSGGVTTAPGTRRAIAIVVALLITLLGIAGAHHMDSASASPMSSDISSVAVDVEQPGVDEMSGTIAIMIAGCVALAIGCVLGMMWAARKWIARQTSGNRAAISRPVVAPSLTPVRRQGLPLELLSVSRI